MTETLAAAIRLHMLGRRFGNGFSEQDVERLLVAILPSALPTLDVERLALAIHEERLDRWGAPCGDVTEAYDDHMSFHRTRAERIAAEYGRLQEQGA